MKKVIYSLLLLLTFSFVLTGCRKSKKDNANLTFTYDFNTSPEGFLSSQVDVPIGYDETEYQIDFRHAEVPIKEGSTRGLMLQGNNKSTDMFMYTYKELGPKDEIKPNTKYKANLTFDVATNVTNLDEDAAMKVTIKAGVVTKAPKRNESEIAYSLNLDKGNHESGGRDLEALGNIAKASSANDQMYEYKSFSYETEIETGSDANVVIIIGSDSAYNGLTKIYYDNISLNLVEIK